MQLTTSDYEVLLEAVELWESSKVRDASHSELVRALLGPNKAGNTPEQTVANMASRLAEVEKNNHVRQERGVLLRAKLIQGRDALTADTMTKTQPVPDQ